MNEALAARPIRLDAPYVALFEATRSCTDCWQTLTDAARATDSLAFRANLLALHASLVDADAGLGIVADPADRHAGEAGATATATAADAGPVAVRALEIDRLAIELVAVVRDAVDTVTGRLAQAAVSRENAAHAVESAIGLGARLAAIVDLSSRAARNAQATGEQAQGVARSASQAMRELAVLAERITAAVDTLRNLSLAGQTV